MVSSTQRHVSHPSSVNIWATPFLFHRSSVLASDISITQRLLDSCSSIRNQVPFRSRPSGDRCLISARPTEFSTFTCAIIALNIGSPCTSTLQSPSPSSTKYCAYGSCCLGTSLARPSRTYCRYPASRLRHITLSHTVSFP